MNTETNNRWTKLAPKLWACFVVVLLLSIATVTFNRLSTQLDFYHRLAYLQQVQITEQQKLIAVQDALIRYYEDAESKRIQSHLASY